MFRPITEEEFFDAVEEELDKRDQMEQESNESNRLKQQAAGQQAVTPNEHHSQSVGLDFKIRVRKKFLSWGSHCGNPNPHLSFYGTKNHII